MNVSWITQRTSCLWTYIHIKANQAIDSAIDGIKQIAKELPAFRDVSNFSSDPKFCETIFLSNLDQLLKNYVSSQNIEEETKARLFKTLKKPLLKGTHICQALLHQKSHSGLCR